MWVAWSRIVVLIFLYFFFLLLRRTFLVDSNWASFQEFVGMERGKTFKVVATEKKQQAGLASSI